LRAIVVSNKQNKQQEKKCAQFYVMRKKKMTMNLLIVEKVVTFPQIRFVVSFQKKN